MDLREQRKQYIEAAKGIIGKAETEGRAMTAEEVGQYDELMVKIDGLAADVERQERLSFVEAELRKPDIQAVKPMPDGRIGMSLGEIRSYSLVRALRAAAAGNWANARLEHEASEAVARQLGRDPQGFFVPTDWSGGAEMRDLTTGSALGGPLISTDLLSMNFIDLLRNRMVVRAAGATVLGGLVGNVAIPRQSGGGTAYWVAEGIAPTESQQATDQVTLTPKTVGAFTDITRKLLKQSSIDVEMMVRNDLATCLALELDRVALHGSGSSNEPTGIDHTTGIGSVAGGGSGAAPSWANILSLETEVAVDNADIGRLAYITNAKMRGKLKGTMRVATYGDTPVWKEDSSTPLNGYPALVTNQVSSTLTKGSASTCSAIFFGNWGDLLIGLWGVLDVLVDPYTGSTTGTVRVVELLDADIAVRHAESFAAMLDALTV
jgi:HK97 family phage major capsid protein